MQDNPHPYFLYSSLLIAQSRKKKERHVTFATQTKRWSSLSQTQQESPPFPTHGGTRWLRRMGTGYPTHIFLDFSFISVHLATNGLCVWLQGVTYSEGYSKSRVWGSQPSCSNPTDFIFSPLVFLSCLCIKRFLITNVFSSVQRLIYEILMRKICLLGDAEAHRGQFTFCFISQPGVLQKRKQNESSTEHKHRNINSEIYV